MAKKGDEDKKVSKDSKLNWQEKAEEYLNGWKRAKADYLNLKKEVKSDQEQTMRFANLLIISELLPVIDNFKIAVEHLQKENTKIKNNCVDGFAHISKQFDDFLKSVGVEKIDTKDADFNPVFHEAVEHKHSDKIASGKIIKENFVGYLLNGKVLRPAKVVVAK